MDINCICSIQTVVMMEQMDDARISTKYCSLRKLRVQTRVHVGLGDANIKS